MGKYGDAQSVKKFLISMMNSLYSAKYAWMATFYLKIRLERTKDFLNIIVFV